MRRRLVLIFAGFIAIVLLAIATLPWWLGAAARTFGGRYGVTFRAYERHGYSRFVLHDFRLQRDGVVVTASRVEADTPALWTWRHFRSEEAEPRVEKWAVEVQKRQTPPKPGPSGWVPLRRTLQSVASTLNRWVPIAAVGEGVVRWPGGEISIKSARWRPDTLEVQALHWRTTSADAKLVFIAPEDEIRVTASTAAYGTSVALVSRGPAITGTAIAAQQHAKFDAQFGPEGWIPLRAGLQADELKVPGDQLKLGHLYAEVHGHAYVGWQSDHFLADVALKGEPLASKSAPPLEAVVRGNGDGRTFTVQAINLIMPGVVANLSEPVTVDRSGQIAGGAARFWIRADLTQQPWVKASGTVTGEARVVSRGAAPPNVDFQCTVGNLAVGALQLESAEAAGQLEWPRLQVSRVQVTMSADEHVEASGGWNFQTKSLVDASAKGSLRGQTIAALLPSMLHFDRANFEVTASGEVGALKHKGKVEVTDFRVATIAPAAIAADWHGVGTKLESFSADVRVGSARVTAGGALDAASGVRFTALKILQDKEEPLELAQPAQLNWKPTLALQELHLRGPKAGIDASIVWGPAGKIDLAVRNIPSTWIKSFVPIRGPSWTVLSFAIAGTWDNGPMKYSTGGGFAVEVGEGRTVTIALAGRGDEQGIGIDALHAVESGHDVVNAAGRIPLIISPGKAPIAALNEEGKVEFEAETVPNAAFWQQLAAVTGVELREPQIRAEIDGTWRQPRGKINLTVTHLAMDPKRFARPLPTIENLDVAVTANLQGVQLDRFGFNIEGQAVHASGRLPVPQRSWGEAAQDPMSFLRRGAQVRIEVPDAEVAMFSRFLPAALAPTGRLQADIRFDRGALGGFLKLRDAASRPLGPLGVLQQVSADVEFSEHRVNLQRVTATAGGEPLVVSGFVELPTIGWLGGTAAEPRYEIALEGKNLPFVRQAGLLVRGDLDLKLQSPTNATPRISGKVVLRDSLFLSDVRAFLPHGGGASPSRRPPYFSVETSPLNTWVLDIDVSGTRFIRMRMPVFVGVASAHFHLGGTLGDPRAIGDATVDEGRVLMPFAAFDVRQGAVRLTEEDPFEPTIFLTGTGRHFGYDLTMEITGKASSPNLLFRSSPALDSDQVLLMVMTGAPPSNEVSTTATNRAIQIGKFVGGSVLSSITGSTSADRLTISSGEKISEQGNETYDIEYKLNDRWALTGEYDEFDEYNIGFKWRVAPKKKPR